MGCFDTVHIRCPHCGQVDQEQSKADECMLAEYDIESAPATIQADLASLPFIVCKHCKGHYKVVLQTMVSVQRL